MNYVKTYEGNSQDPPNSRSPLRLTAAPTPHHHHPTEEFPKIMSCLPAHGRVSCNLCYSDAPVSFDQSRREQEGWRITANPLAWGNTHAEVVVLGFSKGPTQSGALATTPHDAIAYKGRRHNVGRILEHVGLLALAPGELHRSAVDRLIVDRQGRFHFSSLIRCTVERQDSVSGQWKGTGGGMLDRFIKQPFGQDVTNRCVTQFLGALPSATKLAVLFGLGTDLNYVRSSLAVFSKARPGAWRKINNVSYTDEKLVVVHVEHFASQGSLIPDWLGETDRSRKQLGLEARQAVHAANAANF